MTSTTLSPLVPAVASTTVGVWGVGLLMCSVLFLRPGEVAGTAAMTEEPLGLSLKDSTV